MKTLTALIVALGMLVCAPVFADEEDTTIYEFEDEKVMGDVVRSGGAGISVRKPTRSSSLVKVRQNFINEMFKSVEHI